MKTPEELYGKHGSRRFGLMSMVDFTEALSEDRQQIKDMIDEMEEESGYYVDSNYKRGYKTALNQLRSKL